MGKNGGGAITDSYATSSVTGDEIVGGLVGFNDNDSTITGSYATGSVTGSTVESEAWSGTPPSRQYIHQ